MMQCLGVQRQRAKRASHSIGAKTYVDARWVVAACRARACWQMFAIHFSTVLSNSWSRPSRAGHMHLLTLRAPRLGFWQEQRSSAHPAPPTGLTMVASTAARTMPEGQGVAHDVNSPGTLHGASTFMSASLTLWVMRDPLGGSQHPLKWDRPAALQQWRRRSRHSRSTLGWQPPRA